MRWVRPVPSPFTPLHPDSAHSTGLPTAGAHLPLVLDQDQENKERRVCSELRLRAGQVTCNNNQKSFCEKEEVCLEMRGVPHQYTHSSLHGWAVSAPALEN